MNQEENDGIDVFITAVEVNEHHGVGILLKRYFNDGRRIVVLRSEQLYAGQSSFGEDHLLGNRTFNESVVKADAERILAGRRVRRILAVPYNPGDFYNACVVKALTGAALVTYLMDDQNLFSEKVSDGLVGRLLGDSDLVLSISAEMSWAYGEKYGCRIETLPPLIPKDAPKVTNYWRAEPGEPVVGAILGNVWSDRRFSELRRLIRRSGITLDWYGNGSDAPWLTGTFADWQKDGIRCLGFMPETDLVAALASYPFVLIPSGSCGEDDDNPGFSWLSLPSRVLFVLACAPTPLIVLGSEMGAAGFFVTQAGVGVCASPSKQSLQKAIKLVTDPEKRASMIGRTRELSSSFRMDDPARWIWESLEAKNAVKAEFRNHLGSVSGPRAEALRTALQRRPRKSTTFRVAFLPRVALPTLAAGLTHQLTELVSRGLIPADWSAENAELSTVMKAQLLLEASSRFPKSRSALLVGDFDPRVVSVCFGQMAVWKLQDPRLLLSSKWIGQVVAANAKAALDPVPRRFDMVVSAGVGDRIGVSEADNERFAFACDDLLRSRGVHFHAFSVVTNKNFDWIHPLYYQWGKISTIVRKLPLLRHALERPDIYFMSPSAYDRYWKSSTGVSSENFGQCSWVRLAWSKPTLAWRWFDMLRVRFQSKKR